MKTPTKNKLKIVAGIAILVLALIACGNSTDANTGSATTPGTTATSAPATTTFKVGQTVKVGNNWQVVVNGVKTSQGGQYDTLKSGDVYLLVDISLKNLSGQEQDMSSELNWSIKDTTGQSYTETVITDAPSTPDGKVAAGSLLRGTITYEVPTSQKSFTLAFQPDIVSGGQTIWNLSV